MYVIPIDSTTLDLIEGLNDGVRPTLEDEPTFYIYKGKDEHADIVTRDWLNGKENMSGHDVKIFHIED